MTAITTTAAATKAGVTVATIRTWCRRNVIAAVKTSGRWVIDTASLAHRIAIGEAKRATTKPKYQVTEGTSRYGSTTYTVTRTDGTPAGYGAAADFRISSATYMKREHADIHCEFLNRTPDEYRIERDFYPSRNIRSGHYWKITGSKKGDPTDVRHTWDDDQAVVGDWPAGTRPVDVLVRLAQNHAEGAEQRIAKKAESDAIAAAEATIREAREAQLAQVRRTKGDLATPRQVAYILQLLQARDRSGDGGGFYYGPTNQAGVEEMSKVEASTYITSLKGDY